MILVFTWKDSVYFNASNLAYQVSHFKRAPNWLRSKKGRAAMAKALEKTNHSATTPLSFESDENKPPENHDSLYKKDKFLWLHEVLMPYFCRWLADWVEESFQNAMLEKLGESGQVKINAEGQQRENTNNNPHKRMKMAANVDVPIQNKGELCEECSTDEEVEKMPPMQKKTWFEESFNIKKQIARQQPFASSNSAEVEWKYTNRTVPPRHGSIPFQPISKRNHSIQGVTKHNAIELPPLPYTRTQSASHSQTTDSLENHATDSEWNSKSLITPTESINTKERELEIAKELLGVEQARLQVLERRILLELWSKTEKDDADIQFIKQSVHLFLVDS